MSHRPRSGEALAGVPALGERKVVDLYYNARLGTIRPLIEFVRTIPVNVQPRLVVALLDAIEQFGMDRPTTVDPDALAAVAADFAREGLVVYLERRNEDDTGLHLVGYMARENDDPVLRLSWTVHSGGDGKCIYLVDGIDPAS